MTTPSVPSDDRADAAVLERYAITLLVLLIALGAVYAAQGAIVGAFTTLAAGMKLG